MSVELRLTPDGTDLECDWGRIRNPDANPRFPIDSLVLVGDSWFMERLLLTGPVELSHGEIASATVGQDGRWYVHMEYEGQRWTWEVFEAHWWDGDDLPIMIGRWPD